MSTSVSLVQLNIELDRHFERIFPFLEKINPEVVCVQELRENDISYFEEKIHSKCFYVPMASKIVNGVSVVFGVGIFSRLQVFSSGVKYYHGEEGSIPDFVPPIQDNINFALLYCDVIKDGLVFRIGTTHFTWSPKGKPDNFQYRDLPKLLDALKEVGEIVFAGDFNAPRGGEIFSELAKRYKDNVPAKYTTSIDTQFHKSPEIKDLMVDGIFSTNSYLVTEVEMICGLSDHCALVAKVNKV